MRRVKNSMRSIVRVELKFFKLGKLKKERYKINTVRYLIKNAGSSKIKRDKKSQVTLEKVNLFAR